MEGDLSSQASGSEKAGAVLPQTARSSTVPRVILFIVVSSRVILFAGQVSFRGGRSVFCYCVCRSVQRLASVASEVT